MDLNTVRKVCQKADCKIEKLCLCIYLCGNLHTAFVSQPLLLPTLTLQLLGLEIHIRKLGVIMHLHVT